MVTLYDKRGYCLIGPINTLVSKSWTKLTPTIIHLIKTVTPFPLSNIKRKFLRGNPQFVKEVRQNFSLLQWLFIDLGFHRVWRNPLRESTKLFTCVLYRSLGRTLLFILLFFDYRSFIRDPRVTLPYNSLPPGFV